MVTLPKDLKQTLANAIKIKNGEAAVARANQRVSRLAKLNRPLEDLARFRIDRLDRRSHEFFAGSDGFSDITRRKFDGAEVHAYYGEYEDGGGTTEIAVIREALVLSLPPALVGLAL